MKFIPKKYMQNLDEVYKDDEGYWAYTKKGFMFEGMGCHTAHEDTQKALLEMIRTMVPCDCSECKEEEVVVEETPVVEEVQVAPIKPKYKVVIKRKSNDEIVKALETTKSHRIAMKTEVGVNINLNHKEFHTAIVNVECGHCDEGELNPDEVMNALSRKDNDTYICRVCEGKELQAELDALNLS